MAPPVLTDPRIVGKALYLFKREDSVRDMRRRTDRQIHEWRDGSGVFIGTIFYARCILDDKLVVAFVSSCSFEPRRPPMLFAAEEADFDMTPEPMAIGLAPFNELDLILYRALFEAGLKQAILDELNRPPD